MVQANPPVENQERKGVAVVKRRKAAWGERVGLGWTVVRIRRECLQVPRRPRRSPSASVEVGRVTVEEGGGILKVTISVKTPRQWATPA